MNLRKLFASQHCSIPSAKGKVGTTLCDFVQVSKYVDIASLEMDKQAVGSTFQIIPQPLIEKRKKTSQYFLVTEVLQHFRSEKNHCYPNSKYLNQWDDVLCQYQPFHTLKPSLP